jgi:calcineurin-like phosphoesterase family protein
METMIQESRCSEDVSRYRLDLRLGIPHSRIQGALEWWVGDPGLCRDPDRHPYLVLAEISSRGWGVQQDVMQAVARSAEESGPILVSVKHAPGMVPGQEVSFYQVFPSPGLRSFVFLLSRSCPVTIRPGSFADGIARGTPAPFTLVPPLPAGESRSTPRRIFSEKKRRPENRQDGDCSTPIVRSLKDHEEDPVLIEILRIILRKDGSPVAEYDLSRKTWLPSSQSHLRKNARITLRRFRIGKGYQLTRSRFQEEPQIYVISDLHLGHANSIPRYKRPFLSADPGEMDRVLIRNWNWTVKAGDSVIFLGDLSYMSMTPPGCYLGRLAGNIFYLKGNHDPYYPYMSHCLLMRYRGMPYLFIHDPDELVKPFDGWVIHGHVHNKDVARYPFFNPHTRTVNVSAEMVGYRPISLDEIHSLVVEMDEVIPFRDLSLTGELPRHDPASRDRCLPGRGFHAGQA